MTTYRPAEYAKVLAEAGLKLDRRAVATMNRAAGNIKRDWRDKAATRNPIHAKKYASSIVMKRTQVIDGHITVTIMPRQGRHSQGNLGNVLELGDGGNNVAQHSNLQALQAELPSLHKWLAKYAADALR